MKTSQSALKFANCQKNVMMKMMDICHTYAQGSSQIKMLSGKLSYAGGINVKPFSDFIYVFISHKY